MKKIFLIKLLVFCTNISFAQTKFEYNNYIYSITDTVSGITYGFDSGSDRTNIIDKGLIKYKTTGYIPFFNTSGKIKTLKTIRLKENISEAIGIDANRAQAQILISKKDSIITCNIPDVLFGTKVMKKNILTFDNKNNSFKVISKLPDNISLYHKMNLKRNFIEERYYVEFMINGKEIKFLIDTASSNAITCNDNKILNKPGDTYTYNSLNGFKVETETSQKYTSNSISHDSFDIKNDMIYFHEGKNIIGNSFFLNYENVIFDLKNKAIYLKNEFRAVHPFSDKILFMSNAGDNIEIGFINTNSEYYKSGLRVGDVITFDDQLFEEKIRKNPCDSSQIIREYLKNNKKLPKIIKK